MQEKTQKSPGKGPLFETEGMIQYVNGSKERQSGNLLFDQEQMLLLDSLWRSFQHYFVQIVVLIVTGAVLLGGICFFGITPMYSSQATLVVGSSRDAGGTGTTDIASQSYAYNELVAKELVATFPYILENEVMTELIKLDLEVSNINGTISASSIADTGMFTLTVSSNSATDAYDILTSAIKNFSTAASLGINSYEVSLIEEPTLAKAPYNRASWLKGTALGALSGLMIAIAMVWIRANRKTIRSNDDFMDYLNVESLGMVPQVKLKKLTKDSQAQQGNKKDLSGELLLLTNRRLGSSFIESIRALRIGMLRRIEMMNRETANMKDSNSSAVVSDEKGSNINHQSFSADNKVILFTSTLPGEGKSTIATNVALSLAQNGFQTVLLDGDLRAQDTKSILGLQKTSSPALIELVDNAKTQMSINIFDYLLSTPYENLWLLAGDTNVNDPQPILTDPVIGKLILKLREAFDYIIIDTPPCALMADALQLAEYADCAVFVIRQEIAERSQIRDSIEALSDTGITILGCVLNGAEAGVSSNYGSNYYGYKYASYGNYGGNYGYGAKQ